MVEDHQEVVILRVVVFSAAILAEEMLSVQELQAPVLVMAMPLDLEVGLEVQGQALVDLAAVSDPEMLLVAPLDLAADRAAQVSEEAEQVVRLLVVHLDLDLEVQRDQEWPVVLLQWEVLWAEDSQWVLGQQADPLLAVQSRVH